MFSTIVTETPFARRTTVNLNSSQSTPNQGNYISSVKTIGTVRVHVNEILRTQLHAPDSYYRSNNFAMLWVEG